MLSACGGSHGAAPAPSANADAVPVTVARVASTGFATPVELSGTLSAVRSVTIGAVSAGRIVAITVRAGDHVAAGDVLAQVDTSGYRAGLAQAQAGASAAAAAERASTSASQAAGAAIDGARAQLSAAQSRAGLARVTAGRMATLYRDGAISRQQNDEMQSNAAAGDAAVAQARAGLSGALSSYAAASAQSAAAADAATQARAGVAGASVPLRDTTLNAPFAGIITTKFVDVGAVVGAGSPVLALENTDQLELDVAVPHDDIGALSPNTRVNVRVDAIGAKAIPATVRAIIPSENPALRTATVKFALEGREGLLAGMFARVSIGGARHEGSAVALAAVVTRAGQSGVFIVHAGKASFFPVETAAVLGDRVEVRGLPAGPHDVAITNLQRLTDGTPVSVTR